MEIQIKQLKAISAPYDSPWNSGHRGLFLCILSQWRAWKSILLPKLKPWLPHWGSYYSRTHIKQIFSIIIHCKVILYCYSASRLAQFQSICTLQQNMVTSSIKWWVRPRIVGPTYLPLPPAFTSDLPPTQPAALNCFRSPSCPSYHALSPQVLPMLFPLLDTLYRTWLS